MNTNIFLPSGKLMIFDYSNLAYWLSEPKDTDELYGNHYMDKGLYETLQTENKNEVVFFQEMIPYLINNSFSHSELCRQEKIAVVVNCEENHVEVREVDGGTFVVEIRPTLTPNQTKTLGMVSIDGAHVMITDVSYITKERFGYDNDRNEEATFMNSDKCFKKIIGDGLLRIDGLYDNDTLVSLHIQELPRKQDNSFDLNYKNPKLS